MTARRLYVPEAMPSRDANGRALLAKLKFYEPDSALDTLKAVYTDGTLTTAHNQPIMSNASGQFPAIYADSAELFDVGWYDQAFGRQLGVWENISPAAYVTVSDVRVVTPLDFGALADGTTDDGPAFQLAINDLIVRGGGTLRVPAGHYNISTPVVIDRSTVAAYLNVARVSIVGDGSDVVQIDCATPAGDYAFTLTGGVWGSGGNTMQQTVSGLTLNGLTQTPAADRRGLLWRQSIFCRMVDVRFIQFNEATYLEDMVGLVADRCVWTFNNHGIEAHPGPNVIGVSDDGSPPNEFTFVGCHWIANRNRGFTSTYNANLVLLGGSMEGNGQAQSGIADEANVYGFRLTNAGYNGAYAILTLGFHCETNRGKADFWIEHADQPCGYSFQSCDFLRNGTTYVDHHIWFDTTGATAANINVEGCGFHGVNSYSPSSSRKVCFEGTVTGALHTWNLRDNLITNAVERADLGWKTFSGTVTATTGTVTTGTYSGRYRYIDDKTIACHLVVSVTTNGTGSNTLIAALPVASKSTIGVAGRNNSGQSCQGFNNSAGTEFRMLKYDASYPGGDAASLTYDFIYEAA